MRKVRHNINCVRNKKTRNKNNKKEEINEHNRKTISHTRKIQKRQKEND